MGDSGFLFDWHDAILAEDSPLTATERHVALTLSTHMSIDGDSCYPSIRTLAAECNRSTSTVTTALQSIFGHGFLEIEPGRGGRDRKPSRYYARVPQKRRGGRDKTEEETSRSGAGNVAISGRKRRGGRDGGSRDRGSIEVPTEKRRAHRDKTEDQNPTCSNPECVGGHVYVDEENTRPCPDCREGLGLGS